MRTYRQEPKPPVHWHPTDLEFTVMAKLFLALAELPTWKSRIDCFAMVAKYGIFEAENPEWKHLREALGLPEWEKP